LVPTRGGGVNTGSASLIRFRHNNFDGNLVGLFRTPRKCLVASALGAAAGASKYPCRLICNVTGVNSSRSTYEVYPPLHPPALDFCLLP
jgi:hypothetical protein